MKSFEEYLSESLSNAQLAQVEKFADKLFAHFDIDIEFTKHFKDRVNDTRNRPAIGQKELMTFFQKAFVRYGEQISSMSPGKQAILVDLQKELNLPFVFKWDGKNFEFDLIAKTIMRKHDFKSGDKKLRF